DRGGGGGTRRRPPPHLISTGADNHRPIGPIASPVAPASDPRTEPHTHGTPTRRQTDGRPHTGTDTNVTRTNNHPGDPAYPPQATERSIDRHGRHRREAAEGTPASGRAVRRPSPAKRDMRSVIGNIMPSRCPRL